MRAQMESSSTIYKSPSFNRNSSNNIADIADRVVLELLTENSFSFSDVDNRANIENTNSHTESVNQTEEEDLLQDEQEFEFPIMCGDSNLCYVLSESVSDDQISPRYPVFDRSLLSDVDLNLCNGVDTLMTESKEPVFDRSMLSDVDLNLRNGVDTPTTESKPPRATRSSLLNLFDEDRETTSSDDIDGVTPGTYCIWKPKTHPDPNSNRKHKKSNSISIGNTSNRWKVRDLLKRSYSDDNCSSGKDLPVLLFIPPVSPNLKNSETTIKIGKTGKVGSTKTEKNIPAYKSKIGNVFLSPYLPYREDQLAAYANFTGLNKNINW